MIHKRGQTGSKDLVCYLISWAAGGIVDSTLEHKPAFTTTGTARRFHKMAFVRMLLPLVKHIAAGGAKLVPAVFRSKRLSASEKADIEWCGAADRGRPAATDQLALGKRQVGNNFGHCRGVPTGCQDGWHCPVGPMAPWVDANFVAGVSGASFGCKAVLRQRATIDVDVFDSIRAGPVTAIANLIKINDFFPAGSLFAGQKFTLDLRDISLVAS